MSLPTLLWPFTIIITSSVCIILYSGSVLIKQLFTYFSSGFGSGLCGLTLLWWLLKWFFLGLIDNRCLAASLFSSDSMFRSPRAESILGRLQ